MLSIKTMLAAFALATVPISTLAAPAASAQGTVVVVVDSAQLMRETRAGKDVIAKVNSIEAAMERELQPLADTINTEGQAIETRTANMTPEAMRADAALRTQVEAYAKKVQEFNQKRQIAAQELNLTERKAWSDFFTALQPVLQEVVNETGAQIMIERSDVMYVATGVDVSASALAKMDARTPSIVVTRQKLPANPQ